MLSCLLLLRSIEFMDFSGTVYFLSVSVFKRVAVETVSEMTETAGGGGR